MTSKKIPKTNQNEPCLPCNHGRDGSKPKTLFNTNSLAVPNCGNLADTEPVRQETWLSTLNSSCNTMQWWASCSSSLFCVFCYDLQGILEWVMDSMRKGNKDVQERIIILQKEKDQVCGLGQQFNSWFSCPTCPILEGFVHFSHTWPKSVTVN